MAERQPVEIRIDYNWCKCCYLCIEVCPQDVFERSDYIGEKGVAVPLVAHPEECVRCRLCELMCPDIAISLREIKDEKIARSGR